MRINVVMPQLGESVVEGEVTAWLKQPGDAVERDEALAEVTTDKATVEIPAPATGTLVELTAEQGETVQVGARIAVIETSGEQAATAVETPAPQPREKTVEVKPPPQRKPEQPKKKAGQGPEQKGKDLGTGPRMTPIARRLIREFGLDSATIPGTGAGGRITREDVLQVREEQGETPGSHSPQPAPRPSPKGRGSTGEGGAETARRDETGRGTQAEVRPAPPSMEGSRSLRDSGSLGVEVGEDDETVALTPMRRRIAQRLVRAHETIPHVTTVVECDFGAVADLRRQHKAEWEEAGVRLTYLPFVMRAAVEALRAFPAVNSSWGGDKLVHHKRIHLGIAVAVQEGLAVPVIRNTDGMSIRDLARRLAEVADHARSGRLPADEIEGATFTITNPGRFGSVFSTPLINPPNAAILGLGRIAETPVVRDGRVVVRLMCHLCLSYDHRIVDGETAIKFLQHMRQTLEQPGFEMG